MVSDNLPGTCSAISLKDDVLVAVVVAEIRGDDEVWKNDGRRHARKDDRGRFSLDQNFGDEEVILGTGGVFDDVVGEGGGDGEVILVIWRKSPCQTTIWATVR